MPLLPRSGREPMRLNSSSFDHLPAGPVFVHSDAFRAIRQIGMTSDVSALPRLHLETLETLVQERAIWMPSFNYDFCNGVPYDVCQTPSQVGPISEYFRTHWALWRSPVPVFSISGTGHCPASDPVEALLLDPFGPASLFDELCALDGSILWWGAPFASTTFIHYVERISGTVTYRYDKDFKGHVKFKDSDFPITLRYHVRPFGQHLEYCWDNMLGEAVRAGVVTVSERDENIMWSSAQALRDHWLGVLAANPFGLLDEESQRWILPFIEERGRPLSIFDFE